MEKEIEVIATVTQNTVYNGKIYFLNKGQPIKLPLYVANIFYANGYIKTKDGKPLFETADLAKEVRELWEPKNPPRKKLKKYKGNKVYLCMNGCSISKELIVQRYGDKVDGFRFVEGKYRFYGGDWTSQIVKRNQYLKEPGILFILDQDEEFTGTPKLPKNADVGWVTVKDRLGTRKQPRIFRWVEGMHYLKRHHNIYDGNGDLIASHLQKGERYKHVEVDVEITNNADKKDVGEKREEYRRLIASTELLNQIKERDFLTIAQFNVWDLAGISERLSRGINEYTDAISRSFVRKGTYLNYPIDVPENEKNKEIVDAALRSADVLLFHEFYSHKPTPEKIVHIHHHGTYYRLNKPVEEDIFADLVTVSTVDLLDIDERSLLLPSPVDGEWVAKHRKPTKEFTIGHTTTSRKKRGSDVIISVADELGIKLNLIEGIPHKDAVRMKGKADIFFDNMAMIGYGVGAVEAMFLGQPVICGVNDRILELYEEIFGYIPIIPVRTEEDIKREIIRLREDEKYYKKFAELGRKHAKKYHDTEVVAKKLVNVYKKLLFGEKIIQEDLC